MDEYIAAAVAILVIFVAIAVVLRRRRRRVKCSACGARIPRGAHHCPACGAKLSPDVPDTQAEDPPKPVAGSVELTASSGPLAPQHFPISSEGLSIGRLPNNDVALVGELTVSRHHAVIALEQGQYVLYDRDSANGTWVNEQRVFRHVLTPGDRIQIWQSQFVFSVAGAPVPSPPPIPTHAPVVGVVGEYFDGYYLESLIGRGGMSEVFKGRDPNGQTVAVKILQETNPYLVTKFVQEGNKVGPLLRGHPNIVYVHEFGQSDDNRLYLVMEFVDAPSLRKTMQRQLAEPQMVSIMGQTCAALAFAHQNNIVHRDIKPENVLVTADGTVKVLDFGIAKLTSASTVTRDKIVGTPEYISPEQARGDPVRPASDVYSLGVVLYEMLTGSVPFPRPRNGNPYMAAMEVIRQHLREDPQPIRERNPQAIDAERLERVTMRALEKDVKDRYATAKEMGEALGYKEAVELPTTSVRPVRPTLRVVQGSRKGQRIPLAEESLALGRLDFDSSDTSISRRHVNIIYRGGGYWLQDLSKNGTWVDNQRVFGEIPLSTGAMIVFGENVLRLEMGQQSL